MDNNKKNNTIQPVPENYICIRDKCLKLDELANKKLSDKAYIQTLRKELQYAEPYQHIVTRDWFNPVLLELVHEEFENIDNFHWKKVYTDKQNFFRNQILNEYGPATNLYFSLVNSGWFINLLSSITKVDDLVPDPLLYGGGLHETKNGGGFGVHVDFTNHPSKGLYNEMIFMTYLNKNWNSSWNGALELWDPDSQHCVKKIEPEFGQSVLMRNGPKNFHGHPTPLNTPPGISRRSIASYYYTNPLAQEMYKNKTATRYLTPDQPIFSAGAISLSKIYSAVNMFLPHFIRDGLKKFITQR